MKVIRKKKHLLKEYFAFIFFSFNFSRWLDKDSDSVSISSEKVGNIYPSGCASDFFVAKGYSIMLSNCFYLSISSSLVCNLILIAS